MSLLKRLQPQKNQGHLHPRPQTLTQPRHRSLPPCSPPPPSLVPSLRPPANYTSDSPPPPESSLSSTLTSCIITVYTVRHNTFPVAKRQLPCDTAGGGSGAENVCVCVGGGSYHSSLNGDLNLILR